MNNDDKTPDVPKELGPELEARIVAWVAGEASAFEASELTRLTGENPELAVFKRRIEAVQGLVAEAVRPEKAPLRLAPERRASLLKAIGAAGTAEEAGSVGAPKTPRLWVTRQSQIREHRWMLVIAACAVVGMFLFVQFAPPTRSARVYELDLTSKDARQSRMAVELPLLAPNEESADGYSYKAPTLSDIPAAPLASPSVSFGAVASPSLKRMKAPASAALQFNPSLLQMKASASAALQLSPPAPASPTAAPGWAAEEVKMSPFTVTASEDRGYTASSTLAGTRVRTDLRDLSSSISATTNQFFADTGASNSQDLLTYGAGKDTFGSKKNATVGSAARTRTGGQEWASKTGDFAQIGNLTDASAAGGIVDQRVQATASFQQVPASPADVNVQTSGGGSNEEVVMLSPFVVEKAKDDENIPKITVDDTASDKKSINGATAGQTAAQSEAPAAKAEREDDKMLKPAARPALPVEISVETSAAKEPVSTFSLHVSDVSFRLAQAALARGEAPDPALIRPEEFYNAFDYGDPAPAASEKIECRIEQAAHPILQQRNLVRIAMKVPATGRGAGQPLRLTVLLDTSGSMEREDRAAAVRRAMEVLVSLLSPNDRLTLIGFARQPRLLAEQLPGDQAGKILDIVTRTPAEGGTNIEEALKLAGELARRHFEAPAQNRIVLLTDGAANLGNADPAQLAAAIEAFRQQGIAFDACGVGTDGLDDAMLEALTRKGDGRYYVLDSPESADAGFARQLAGAFRPAAENVKVQVRFNPARVGAYRLIGFEHYRLKEEDFRNDKVDAAELAAEEAAVALYQVEVLPQGDGELGEVYVRFRDAATRTMVERSWTITFDPQVRAFDQAPPTMQLAGTAALLAEKLAGRALADQIRLDELAAVVTALRSRYAHEARVQELVTMFEQMRRLGAK